METIKYIIVTDKPKLFQKAENNLILTPKDYINFHPKQNVSRQPKVINLSNDYSYLSKGYYVSLLAEARGSQCVPDVMNIIALQWKRNYEAALPELNALLEKNFKDSDTEPYARSYISFFGRHDNSSLEPIARRIFDLYRFPVISFEIKYGQNGKWQVSKIDTPSLSSLSDKQQAQFYEALSKFTGSAWRTKTKKKSERFWLGILYDPEDPFPPSNKGAINKFISVGKKMGFFTELITRKDFSTLLEYDAIFIRETTAINNHTYRFALKAELEDIPCIDDTTSIIRCCNKVYLKELLETHKVPVPKTVIFEKKGVLELPDDFDFPAVLKVPDGSFSRGIEKVSNQKDLEEKAGTMFQKSDIILLQEFLPSEYDWRIGVLNNTPLFAIKYFMAKNHWQIYNHGAKAKRQKSGDHECVPLDKVPENVLKMAQNATKWIGNSLYGVDIKQLSDGRCVVIEVNDNPNIDQGVEDQILGDMLYQKILEHIAERIET